MTVANFINQKTKQLVYYIRAFWRGDISYKEVGLFLWDTLEEWSKLRHCDKPPLDAHEQVFWHLFYQVHSQSEDKLMTDYRLRDELSLCMDFLEYGGFRPFYCIGIRP